MPKKAKKAATKKAAAKKAAPKKAAPKKAAPKRAAPKAAAKKAAPKKAAKKAAPPAKAPRRKGLRKLPEGAKFRGKNRLATGFGNVDRAMGGMETAGGRGSTYDKTGKKVTKVKDRLKTLRKSIKEQRIAFFDKKGKRVKYANAINAKTGDLRAGLRAYANAGSGADG